MALPILLPDALTDAAGGFALRVSLPWIRSMPIAAVTDLQVSIDGEPVDVRAVLEGREVRLAELGAEQGWWFLQDRLVLVGDRALGAGEHDVSVSFELIVPYLQVRPDSPLALPFRADARLQVGAEASDSVASGSAPIPTDAPLADASAAVVREEHPDPVGSGSEWDLGASAFNWTPEVIRADRDAAEIAISIVRDGVAPTIEIEPGQLWRSFPEPASAEVESFRARLEAAGGRVSIIGGSLDDWALPARRRTVEERAAFLVPQLRAAAAVGARGVRVPFGQARRELLERVQPDLESLGVVLYEEIQGQQSLDIPAVAENLAVLDELDDPRIRVLIDISMLMPSLPPSYLAALRAGGVDGGLVDRLESEWRSPETQAAVVQTLRSGAVPSPVHTLFMDLLVRFGRSTVEDLEPLLPLTGAVHLKFWDLDDTDGRVSRPIADIGSALQRTGFTGSLTSEWGGHEWLDDDPAAMTSAHLALARRALAAASVSA